MGIIERIKIAAAVLGGREPQALSWGGISWDDWVRGNIDNLSGGVSETTARAVSTVTACVNLIAGSIAAMPLHLYRRKANDDREAYKDDLWWLLNERPWDSWTAAAFWEHCAASRLFYGDVFARIHRRGRSAIGFEPLHPLNVEPVRLASVDPASPMLAYRVRYPERAGALVTVAADDMIHVPGPGFDGVRSLSQLQYALRNSVGVAAAADKQASAFIGDGVRPDFAIEVPNRMSEAQIDQLRRTFRDRHRGQDTSRVPVVVSGGAKLHQLTMSSEDAQLLETRKFQVEEICRVFGVPPFMVGHTEKTTSWGSGVEQMGLGFVKYTLGRHIAAIEQEFNHKLFRTSRNFCEFVTAGLERGDLKGRYEAYRIALGRAGEPAWMTPNEVRALENLPRSDSFDAAPQPEFAPDNEDEGSTP